MKDDVMDIIKQEVKLDEKKGPEVDPKLAGVMKDIWINKSDEDKLKGKFEKYKTPANCEFLRTKKCNEEIWSLRLSENQRSNDLKLQKVQNSLVKSTTDVTTISNQLLALHRNKELSSKEIRKELGNVVTSSTDALYMLAHTMKLGDTMRRQRIGQAMDQGLKGIIKNIDETSESLFGEDLAKRITDLKANQKAFQQQVKSKNFSRSQKYPRDRYNQGYHNQGYQNQGYQKKKDHYNYKKQKPFWQANTRKTSKYQSEKA